MAIQAGVKVFLSLVVILSLAKFALSQEGNTEALSKNDSSLISDILRLEYTFSPFYLLFPLNPCKSVFVSIVVQGSE